MTTEKVNDLEIIKLADYFSPETFRIVPADAQFVNGGISEVPVNLNLHSDFIKRLNFDIRNLQKLYAFSIMGSKLTEMNGSHYYSEIRKNAIKCIELNDSGELWIVKFEYVDGTSKLYATHSIEVKFLLNECRKPLILW